MCALTPAAPVQAQRFIEHHTIEVHSDTIWPGKRVAFGGLYWGTAYGVCPAGPIQILFEQTRRPERVIGQVPATSVIPFSGGFTSQLSLPDDARIARGTLRFVQHEREVSSSGLCTEPRRPAERIYTMQVNRRPPGAPCTPDNGCAPAPVPTLEIVTSLPARASITGPWALAATQPRYRPGDAVRVVGHDHSDPFNDNVCPPRRGEDESIGFYITDASGTSQRFSTNGHVERGGDLQATLYLPTRALAPGRAVITAVPLGYEGDPVCGTPGTATLDVVVPRPTVTFDTAIVAGASVTVSGAWWRTDRCDSRVDVVLDRGGVERALKHAVPGPLGSFQATVKVPSGPGPKRIVAVQRRSLEVPDRLGRPQRSRCVRRARTIKTQRVSAKKAPAGPPTPTPIATPTPTPPPTPTATPAPTPDPTLEARQTGLDSLQLTGSHWERGDCNGNANPVTITLAHAGKPAETIGTTTPDDAGAFNTEFKPLTVSSGDEAKASQTRCDGSGLSATATVSPA